MEVESMEAILIYMKTSYSRSAGSFQLPGWAVKLSQSFPISLQPNSLLSGFSSFFYGLASEHGICPNELNPKFWKLQAFTTSSHFFIVGYTDDPK